MKFFCFFAIIFIITNKKISAQKRDSSPLKITIKLIKEYELRFSKEDMTLEDAEDSLNISTDSVNQKQYDIEIILKNNSTRPIFIWLMNCSWEDNFRINNNYIYYKGHGCDRNFAELIKFKSGQSKVYKTTLVKSVKFENPCENCIYGPQVKNTKLGLIIFDDIFKPKLNYFLGYKLAMEDKSMWKIIWSNSLHLLTKKEASYIPIIIRQRRKRN